MNAPSFRGWSPIRVYRDPIEGWTVDWCRLGDERFTDPFFAQTIDRALRRPFNRAFHRRTSFEELGDAFHGDAAARPAGIIFHMSRCGSTLVAQMLASLSGSAVFSEPEPVDDVLRAARFDPDVTDEWRIERLRGIAGALGNSVPCDRGRFVIKLDSWHLFDLPLIRRAFPGVPSIVVYRDPVEVLVSHLRQPGWMMVLLHAKTFLALTADEAARLPREEYMARILERMLRDALRDDDPLFRLVNYTELPAAAAEQIPSWFGISLTDDNRRLLAEAGRRDAKQPSQGFVGDTEEKQRRAGDAVRAVAEAKLRPLYDALEARRLAQTR